MVVSVVALLLAGCRAAAPALPASAPAARMAHERSAAAPLPWPDWTRRAERGRGLALRRPVAHRRIDARALGPLLEAELDAVHDAGELRDRAFALQALGLVPPGFDLRAELLAFASDATAGFYSPLHERLYVALDAGAADLEAVAIHELVHALQDQHSPLPALLLGLRGEDDLAFALGAVLEGDALHAQSVDALQTSGAPLPSPQRLMDEMGSRAAAVAYPDVARVLRESLMLQYPLGYRLVHAQLAGHAGAQAGAHRAALLRDPPLSSEQLLHPQKWLDAQARDVPRFVTLPQPAGLRDASGRGCREVARNRLGELGVRIWLVEMQPERGEAWAEGAAAGWDGDQLVVLDCAGRPRLAWLLVADDPREARELAEAVASGLRALVEDRDGSRARGPVRVRRRGERVLATAGLSEAAAQQLWRGIGVREYRDLGAWSAAHREASDRAAALRAAARRAQRPPALR